MFELVRAKPVCDMATFQRLCPLEDPESYSMRGLHDPERKYYKYMYPGKGTLKFGSSPKKPPKRSPIYNDHPDLAGKVVCLHLCRC